MHERRTPRGAVTVIRSRGDIDMTDLLVGLGVALVLPWLVLAVGAALSSDDSGPLPMGEKIVVLEPPMTKQELQMRLEDGKVAATNAREYIKLMDVAEDGQLKDDYRMWADRALNYAEQKFTEVESRVQAHPDGEGGLIDVLSSARRHRSELKPMLERVKQLDILGDR